MAELTTTPSTASCCSTETQATCCEPSEKGDCCATAAAGDACGRAAGEQVPGPPADIRETVREKYAAAARAAAADHRRLVLRPGQRRRVRHRGLRRRAVPPREDAGAAPEAALNASLGCGVPTAVADLHAGETVLDLGSGARAPTCSISARRVGADGPRDRPGHDR